MARSWKIIDRGSVPRDAKRILFTCIECGEDSWLPVVGHVIAQVEMGLLFGDPEGEMPASVSCPYCKIRFDFAVLVEREIG